MRRANGSGSVYKRRDTARRNPWVAVIHLGYSTEGKRIKKVLGSFPTQKDAQKALEGYNVNPKSFEQSKITMGDIWQMAKFAKEKQTGKPISNVYASAWKRYISKLANYPIADLKTMHLQNIIDTSGVKTSRQAQILVVMHMIYKLALANDIIAKDYSSFVKVDALEKSTVHKPFTTSEMRLLWAHSDLKWVQVILVQIYTGLRNIELSGMKFDNVYLDDSYMIGGVKTKAGINRIIPIADCIKPFVTGFYRISAFKKRGFLITHDINEHLYKKGSLIDIPRIYTHLPSIGVGIHKTHDARYTFATMAANYDMNESIRARILGHALKSITESVYTKKNTLQLISAVNALPFGTEMFLSREEANSSFGSHMVATK